MQAFQLSSCGSCLVVVNKAGGTLLLLDLTTGQRGTLLVENKGLGSSYSLVYNLALKRLFVGSSGGFGILFCVMIV